MQCKVRRVTTANGGPAMRATTAVGARVDLAVLAGLTVLAMLPLFAGRYLPFFDYPAHLAVAGALHHHGDPATDVARLWTFDVHLAPNCLHYLFTWFVSAVMPLETASRLFVALFCVAALPAAAAFLLHTFGRDWRLAILVVPLCWGRCLWYGFIGFCAAIPISLVALALMERDLRAPSLRRELMLAATVVLLAIAHFFVLQVTVGLALILMLAHARDNRPLRLLRSGATWLAGPLIVAPWFLQKLHGDAAAASSGGGGLVSAISHLLAARPHLSDYAALLAHWFLDGYTGRADDVLAAVVLITVAGLMTYGRRAPVDPPLAPATRIAPFLVLAVVVTGYIALPFEIVKPYHWWAMNVRLLPLAFVWLVVSLPPGRLDRWARLALVPLAVTAAGYFLYVTVDIARFFNGPSGAGGLAQMLDQLPQGARVSGLYTDYRQHPHYAHYPYHYMSSYAIVHGGGLATPFTSVPYSWTNPRHIPAFPGAGDAAAFRFTRHARGFTHFLVRTCEGTGCIADPLAGRPEVRIVTEVPRWRLYRCIAPPCDPSLP